jgi:hypothetical protein
LRNTVAISVATALRSGNTRTWSTASPLGESIRATKAAISVKSRGDALTINELVRTSATIIAWGASVVVSVVAVGSSSPSA